MAVPSLSFCYGGGLQQSYQPYQPPVPLIPGGLGLPLAPPSFNSNPWVAQCMPPPAPYYQHQQQQYEQYRGNTSNRHQAPMRGRGKNWNRQNRNRFQKQDQNSAKDFHCEACECSFRTEFDLNGHISHHKQCAHPGCDFTATGRVLKDHEMVHRIPKELLFTSEEEIAKWKEERKKKYPTSKRVAEKRLEEEAKIERGETAKDEIHRYCKRSGTGYLQSSAKRGRGGRGRYQRRHFIRGSEKLACPSNDNPDSHDGSNSLDQLASSLAKDTGISGCSSPQKTKTPILRNISRHKATLLEKLLAPEIRRERNTALQCIRHIVKKNFFGIEQESTSNAETNNEIASDEGATDKNLKLEENEEQSACSSNSHQE